MLIKKTKDMTDSEHIAVDNSNNQWLQALSYTAVGTIYPYAGTVAPDSFMICDGSALDKNEYPELFAVIGYSFGGSDDTFNIPDLRGRTLVGLKSDDVDFGAIGKSAGEKAHNLTILETPAHTHALWSNIAGVDTAAANTYGGIGYFPSGKITNQGTYVNTGSAGSGNPHNNMQPYMVCNYIIKVVNKLSNELNIIVNVKADEEYNPNSENAQSGKAVAEAVSDRIPKIITEGHTVGFKMAIALTGGLASELYGTDDEDYTTVVIADPNPAEIPFLAGGEIATYGKGGKLCANTPTSNFDCANKEYVDNTVSEANNDRVPKPTFSSAPFLSVVTVNRGDATFDDTVATINDNAFGAKLIDDPIVEGKSFAHGNFLVQRDGRGNLWTGEPVDDQDCVPYSMYKALLERVEALESKM